MKRLIVFIHGIGDNIMLTPAVRMLRETNPEDEIGLLVPEHSLEIWKRNPNVNRVFSFNMPHLHYGNPFVYASEKKIVEGEIERIRKSFMPDKTDFVVPHALHIFGKSIPIPGLLLNTLPFLYGLDKNEILKICNILGAGKDKKWPKDFYTEIFLDKSGLSQADKIIKKIKSKKIAIFHSKTTSKKRSMTEREENEVLGLLVKNGFKVIWLYGDFNDESIVSVSPKDVSLSAALIKESALFVGVDSGPAHLATALKKPSIIISKAIPPELRFLPEKKVIALHRYDFEEIEKGLDSIMKHKA